MAEPKMKARSFLVAPEEMHAIGQALLERAGADPASARIVMDHVVASSVMGLHSHGVMRVPQYLAEIASGIIDPHAEPYILKTAPSRLAIDGRHAFGQVVGMRIVEALIPLAQETGLAMANGRQLGHTGRIGAYPEALAAAGLVGMAVCNGAPSGHWVAAFGGLDGRISTNPIAFAWPVEGQRPVVADFSTACAPEGVIRLLRDRKVEAPEGYLRDAAGRPTRDPSVLYAVPEGAIQPFGGELGYRTMALALLVEVLTTILNGDAVDDASRKGTDMTILAIAPQSSFAHLASGLSDHMRASPPLDPARPVMMPGDREQRAAGAGGPLRVDGPTWEAVAAAAAKAGLPLPAAIEDS
jgi:LDH2 family malate/lactate/ureidoglycolate dehydrogenase